ARTDSWFAGAVGATGRRRDRPELMPAQSDDRDLARAIESVRRGDLLSEADVKRLLTARGPAADAVITAADELRRAAVGEAVSYVVNCNINYTNICTYHCGFCAFSKGKTHDRLRGRPYLREVDEILAMTAEAAAAGATEVCLQGGIHPDYTGDTYLGHARAIRDAFSGIHIRAFSPLEVTHGARTLGLSLGAFLERLRDAGVRTLPGTAAEILDDEVRAVICPDKLSTAAWLEVVETAHRVGMRTTSTIMFGHVERPEHVARHLIRLRDLQIRTGGLTEFVPLPFVHMEAPLYLKRRTRRGPTYDEAVLLHAVARLVLHPHVVKIQASWVKMGPAGAQACLAAGANDLGGIL
ncbi:MAG: 5-amino-6-(D-ribitylamino)uracil--L-tyrosine 4-hydroxyphenyl transferase CofH, partial [Rhodospirillaceae bacterium]